MARHRAAVAAAACACLAVALALGACQARGANPQSAEEGGGSPSASAAEPSPSDGGWEASERAPSTGAVPVSQNDGPSQEEWPGQSLGYVGPNGEGAYTEDDWSSDEEYADVMREIYKEEYEAPHVYRDGYEEGVLAVTFDRSYGELAAREVVEECGGEWVSSDFKHGTKAPERESDRMATVMVYFPDTPDKEGLERIAGELERRPEVMWAELNGTGQGSGESNDDAWSPDRSLQQYYLHNSGFDRAWDVVKCQGSATVAVIDCGFSLDHPDLAANLLQGYDATSQTLLSASYDDGGGHGTKVAGVVSATAGNGFGVDGASYNAKVFPIRHSTTVDSIPWENVRRALQYVADHESGFDVVNMSFEFTSGYSACEVLLRDLHDGGIACVAASGNQRSSEPTPDMVKYPAAYYGVISVGSVDSSNVVASDSNRNEYVDLCAPGVSIYTTANPLSTDTLGLYYGTDSGTSFAAPQVAAAAALLMAQDTGRNAEDVEELLFDSAVHPSGFVDVSGGGPSNNDPDLRDDFGRYGYGVLDAAAAVGWTASGGSPNTGGSVAEMYAENRR